MKGEKQTNIFWISCQLIALALIGSDQTTCAQVNPYYRSPSSIMGKTMIIPAGAIFEGRIDSTIGSRVSHPGDKFTITLSSPVLANGTTVIIPVGSQVLAEVVEAIPASHIQHKKGMPKPRGKLRVQLQSLRLPDGLTYPLVASLAGENIFQGGRKVENPNLGEGIGYVGTDTSFEAVRPRARYLGAGQQVLSKQEFLRDPIYGQSSTWITGSPDIRSLVERNRELYIDKGSPLSIKLEAPFKIGFTPASLKQPPTLRSVSPAPAPIPAPIPVPRPVPATPGDTSAF